MFIISFWVFCHDFFFHSFTIIEQYDYYLFEFFILWIFHSVIEEYFLFFFRILIFKFGRFDSHPILYIYCVYMYWHDDDDDDDSWPDTYTYKYTIWLSMNVEMTRVLHETLKERYIFFFLTSTLSIKHPKQNKKR